MTQISVEDAGEARLIVSVGPAKDQAVIRHMCSPSVWKFGVIFMTAYIPSA
jgi:hypothetical protein